MPNTVRWALVGTSGWADHTFARAITAGGGALVGAAGSRKEGSASFAARHFAPRVFSGIEEICDCADVDAVWVASPSDHHHDDALLLLGAGKHVLVEKPLATTVDDAEAMCSAAESSDRITAIGFQHRFNPAHQHLAELVHHGHLGALTFACLHMFIQAPEMPAPWRRSLETSGGWAINDLGSHLLDLLNFIEGGFSTVGSALGATRFGLNVDDLAVVLLQRGPAAAVLEVSTALPDRESRVALFGQASHVVVENSWPGGGRVRFGDDVRNFAAADTYAAQVRAFNDAVVSGDAYAGAHWQDGLAVVHQVADAYRIAARDGRDVGIVSRPNGAEDPVSATLDG